MASPAHCFYCFEVLSASFHQKDHISLENLLDLYEQYQKELKEEEDGTTGQEDTITDEVEDTEQQLLDLRRDRLQIPSISRLRDTTPSSRSSVSTPSSVSVNSSNTQLTSTTSVNDLTPTYTSHLSIEDSYPLFVTWNTLSRSGHKHLRGCIGTFEALPLEQGLSSYAITSAFEDTRFPPIPQHLLSNLSCSLTLLADFEECDGPLDWELGKHGIRIAFSNRYRKYGATYLPDVAVEQGWTKEETLESLMRKAGWEGYSRRFTRGSSKPWDEVQNFRVVRYTGLKSSASYSEWQDWQKWAKPKRLDLWAP